MHKTRADAAAAAGAVLFLALLAGESALIVDEPHIRSDSPIESGTAVAAATESRTAVFAATREGRIGIASRDSAHWREARGASGRNRDIVDHPAVIAAKPARPCGVLKEQPIVGFPDMEDPR